MLDKDYKKHVWMVYSRPAIAEREQMKELGLQNADDWTAVITKPVWYVRAIWVARDKDSKFVETKIQRVA